jgi:hypothetical protein
MEQTLKIFHGKSTLLLEEVLQQIHLNTALLEQQLRLKRTLGGQGQALEHSGVSWIFQHVHSDLTNNNANHIIRFLISDAFN